jgi:hypothetical protein
MVRVDDSITVTAVPFHATALPQPLRFSPPYADRAANPDGFSFWWQLMRLVFDLPNPGQFPSLRISDADHRRKLERFVTTCEELAESSILSHRGGISVSVEGGKEKISVDLPSMEALRGTVVLFRQIASDGEVASYTSVRKLMGLHIQRQLDDQRDKRQEWHKRWNRARGLLNSRLLKTMADDIVKAQRGWQDAPSVGDDVRPLELLSLFEYGELIHWGRHRDAMDDLMKDEFHHKWPLHHFVEVVIQLSHFYLGYSVLVNRALDRSTYALGK